MSGRRRPASFGAVRGVAWAAAAALCATANAADQVAERDGVSFWQASEAFSKGPLLVNRMDSNHYQVFAVRRDAPGAVELHARDSDIILVLEGAATFVTGGTVTGARTRDANESTGTGIVDGQARRLEKGDVIVVPNGTPHWFREVSPFIRYFAVKLRQPAADTPAPSTVHHLKGSDAFAKSGLVFDGTEGRFVRVYALRRAKPLGVELHALDTDLVFGVDGAGTFISGGSIAEPRALGPNESTGVSIRDGRPQRLGPGDVLVVPAGTPHWLQSIDGTLDFFAVKVH
jgi:mannose-6-phosphate isomerase-like protein (cupin superfamily)